MIKDVVCISTKWVVKNKGSNSSPVIKARLVGQEFADSTMRGELFAGTPGLPALRYLISKLATVSPGREKMSLAILDIKSAFLYGKARRKIAFEFTSKRIPVEMLL